MIKFLVTAVIVLICVFLMALMVCLMVWIITRLLRFLFPQRSHHGKNNRAEENSQNIRLLIGINGVHGTAKHFTDPLKQSAETGGILLLIPRHRKPPKKEWRGMGRTPHPTRPRH